MQAPVLSLGRAAGAGQDAGMDVAVRTAAADDAPAIASLIETAYAATIAPHFGKRGREAFLNTAAVSSIEARLAGDAEAWVAVRPDKSIVGYAEMDGDHLKMLFVRHELQRSGIGSALLRFLRVLRSGQMVTVNVAPNADAFYLAMGFKPTGPRQQSNGVVFTPMECKF